MPLTRSTPSDRPGRAARLAARAGAVALSTVVLAATPAWAAPALSDDPVTATDQLLYEYTLEEFLEVREVQGGPGLDWSSDGCSSSPDEPFGYDFLDACYRHDFGYRNYKLQERFTETNRASIDNVFLEDLTTICAGDALCQTTAMIYYLAVRVAGGSDTLAGVDERLSGLGERLASR
ncbi:phospholipase [Allostreptomyces psammosilenae]|uniref:Phospholipase A2 n=1 Tax=Allostreptomyces psammosilenae TaxID=1892865 RepID=A0A852ZLL3_9ACTN|nr:phospholipase [Allostreptomyces psammosilenae]NYI03283.1 hypothetical protein [Allostreptomyces psammosilenae]